MEKGILGAQGPPMIPRPVVIYAVGATILTLVGGHRQYQSVVMMTGDPVTGST